ncbi:MAG: hypothetical protein IT280_08710 [Ignavibacteria bacterium]|nr:hypothetical protein [Ignavibacteria bacterium]
MLKFNCFYKKILLAAASVLVFGSFSNGTFAQSKKTVLNRDSFSRIQLSFSIGYSRPLLEAYGEKVTINSTQDVIFIDGKRMIISENFATKAGYGVQTFMKYSFLKKGQVKGLLNIGYNSLIGTYPGPSDYNIGVRIQSFSVGLGTEINPIGHNSSVYPSVFGLLRLNFMGGESFHKAGLDFFKVVPRYGYSAGLSMNFKLKQTIDLSAGYSYSYDNVWNKEPAEETIADAHVIPLRDKKSTTNGLNSNRRIAYWSLYLGMNFFFK